MEKKREQFSSRLSFIIVSVSCAVGLGNIWLMPFRAGEFGGGLYVLMVGIFIFAMGLPVLVSEYAVGRASQKSVAGLFQDLQPKGTKWHWNSYFMMAGNYLLMMFYTLICGFALYYLFQSLRGTLIGASSEEVTAAFANMTGNAGLSVGLTIIILAGCFLAAYFGLRKGIEFVGKYFMAVFFFLMIVLIIRAFTLPGAIEGVRFILIPRFYSILDNGVFRTTHMALGQAVFSVSVGMGSMAVFGSYMNKNKRLFKDGFAVCAIDYAVGILCLLMIFPAAFAFGIPAGAGEGLLFVVMPNVFNHMPASQLWSILFYLGLAFVSVSTAVAVVEGIVALCMDKFGWERKKSVLINFCALLLLCLPAALGRNVWLEAWRNIGMTDLGFAHVGAFFTFLVMEVILPFGSFVFILFVASKKGWGWNNFIAEMNTGEGWKFPTRAHFYMAYILPAIMFFILVFGLLARFFPNALAFLP